MSLRKKKIINLINALSRDIIEVRLLVKLKSFHFNSYREIIYLTNHIAYL